MNKLKIFLLTTCFIFTFAISCFADSTHTAPDSNEYLYYYHFNTVDNEICKIWSNVPLSIGDDGGLFSSVSTSLYVENITTGYSKVYYAKANFVFTSPVAEDFIGNLGVNVIPPWMEVEELPMMVGSIILLIASVGISVLCLMQSPNLVKKLLIFLR